MTAVVAMVYGLQLFVAGLNWFWVLLLLGAGMLGGWQAYIWLPHFTERVNEFLDPTSLGYQIERALRAVAAGGLFGRGPGEGDAEVASARCACRFHLRRDRRGVRHRRLPGAGSPVRVPDPARPMADEREQRPLRPARRHRPHRRVRVAGADQHGGQPQPDPDQGDDAAVHQLWRLVAAGAGHRHGHAAGADPARRPAAAATACGTATRDQARS